MKKYAASASKARELRKWLDRADFIVGVGYRSQPRLGAQRGFESATVDEAVAVHGKTRGLNAGCFKPVE
jgi:hypothetical protein